MRFARLSFRAELTVTAAGTLLLLAPLCIADDAAERQIARGAALFITHFTPEQGLGPLFNHTACSGCHVFPTVGGMGPAGLGTATRVGHLDERFDPLIRLGGPVARGRSIAEFGIACDMKAGVPATANVTSVRNAPGLYGSGLIDSIPDAAIIAGAVDRGDGVHGRIHLVAQRDGSMRVGRFGWKADTATLKQFVADALRNELGITNPLAPEDLVKPSAGCGATRSVVEDDGSIVEALTAFVASLPVPPSDARMSSAGQSVFASIGCTACHTPSLPLADGRSAPLYSDLLLHDLGGDLDDKIEQGQASGHEWRTTPLWGLHARPRFLHDGRALTPAEAIRAHAGEAAPAVSRFQRLDAEEREALLAFLRAL